MSRNCRLFVVRIIVFLGMALSMGCGAAVHYNVSARSNPNWMADNTTTTFALVSQCNETKRDPLTEMNLLSMISTGLKKRGWIDVDSTQARFLFSVDYGMENTQQYDQSGVYTWYDSQGKAHQGGGSASTQTVFKRQVKIYCREKDGTKSEIVWSADCYSEGSTPDVLYPATCMVPYAISVFPKSGTWTRTGNP